jgi:hypothetical protein
MPVRIAAALLILLPACASSLASPIGVLAGPFAAQILSQQQQATHDATAAPKQDQGARVVCQPADETKREAPAGAGRPRGEMPNDETVATRNHCESDVLPQPDKKRSD